MAQDPGLRGRLQGPGITGGAAAPAAAIAPWLNRPWFCGAGGPDASPRTTLKQNWGDPTVNKAAFEGFNRSAHHLARYAGASPAVAQVLANTPTYMIFDDHEVADDWNLNGRWVSKVYNREWGRFVVRNGLLAYTLMQAWGNDPAHFSGDRPGKKVLDAMPAAVAERRRRRPIIDILLGFDKPTTAQPKRIAFNYSLENADYKVAVLDTRTHRAINTTTLEPPNLIDNLDEQLPERPGDRHAEAAARRLAGAGVQPGGDRADGSAARAARDRQHPRQDDRRGARVRRGRRRRSARQRGLRRSAASAAARSTTAKAGRRTSPASRRSSPGWRATRRS